MRSVIGIVAVVIALTGCASTPSSRSASEPGIITLRNSTGRSLASVRVEDARASSGSPRRLGEMSPVLPDNTYVFVRPPNAPPLPPRLAVQWRDAARRESSAEVSIGDALKHATGAPDEALLLEILPSGTVDARIDRALSSR